MIRKLLIVILLFPPIAIAQRVVVTLQNNQTIKEAKALPTINDVIYVGGTNYPLTSAGINAALATCAAGPGKIVLPPGIINIAATLFMTGTACVLEGAGRNITTLQMVDPTNNLTGIVVTSNSRVEHLALVGTGNGGCGFGEGGSNTALGIFGDNHSNVTINDVDVSLFPCQLIASGVGATNWIITNNYIHDGLSEGIIYDAGNYAVISGNIIYRNNFNGIDIGGSKFVTITGNVISQNGGNGAPGLDKDGITLYAASVIGDGVSSENTISSNIIYNNNTHGILVKAGPNGTMRDATITGNTIFDNGIGNGSTQVWGDGINVANDGTNGIMVRTTIVGNTITENSRSGVYVAAQSSSGSFNETIISSNLIESNGRGTEGGYGVVTAGTGGPVFAPADTIVKNNVMINNMTGQFLDGINGIPGTRTEVDGNRTQVLSGSFEVQSPILASGSPAMIVGTGACSTITAQTGGSWAGSFKCSGPAGRSTVTIEPGITAPNGWTCNASNNSYPPGEVTETSYSETNCVLTMMLTRSNDVITWSATAF